MASIQFISVTITFTRQQNELLSLLPRDESLLELRFAPTSPSLPHAQE